MQVDGIFILAAGKGTRMGEIGKSLPKLLWPVFEKRLIDLQVEYAKSLFPNTPIYINAFYNAETIQEYIETSDQKDSFNLIVEDAPIDIGGAIHNLAHRLNYQGNILILNGDQFLVFDSSRWNEILNGLGDCDSVLLSYDVNSNAGYNALNVDSERVFQGVIKNADLARDSVIETYTGTSIINLSKLAPSQGESKFFDTVANPNLNRTKIINLGEIEYWDFGTAKRHYDSHFQLLKQMDSRFAKFLIDSNSIAKEKVREHGYAANNSILLMDKEMELCQGQINYKEFIQPIE